LREGDRMKKYLLLIFAGVALAILAHIAATAERSYEAIGGEVLLLVLPLLFWSARRKERR
jgi:hypothetical protein